MNPILANLIYFILKACIYGVLIVAGVICGKKFRDKKDLQKSK